MAKRLTITPDMGAKIAKAAGVEKIDTSHFAAFEAVAFNTEPVDKAGTIFDKSVATKATLQEMADVIARGESVPLQVMHRPGLPVGKLFDAQVVVSPATGKPELRAQFYIDNRAHPELVLGIDNGTIDEVSIGARPKSLNCSECAFDYMAEGNDFAFFTRTCADGHVLGVNGVHVKFNGLNRWYETSLVSKGAAKSPKIVSPAKALLGDEEYTRLAASGVSPDAYLFFGSATIRKDHTKMDFKELEATITAKVTAETALKAKTDECVALTAQVTELTAKVAKLEGEAGTGVAEVQAKLDGVKPVTDFVTEAAKAALVATGRPESELPADLGAQITLIKATSNALHQLPLGGRSKTPETQETKADFSGFKTRK